MAEFLRKNWILLLTEILIISVFCLFYGRFGNVYVDSFREAYIPEQILNGKVLYKNIFCIYPPLGYMINALLYKIFGVKLSVLYIAGLFATLGSVFFANKIGKMFLNNYLLAGINLFIISALVLSPNVFNAFFPYSYGMLYGIFFALISLYFILKEKYPVSYLFCSLAICSKMEFLPLLFVLVFISKKENIGKNSALFILPIIIVTTILFLQGLRISDLAVSCGLIQIMGNSQTLHEFYSSMGLIPRIEHLPLYITNLIKFVFPYNFQKYQEIILWIFPLISILFVCKYKNLSTKEKIFIVASVLISLKVFFALTMQSYGVYYLIFALISLTILIPNNFKKIVACYLIFWSLLIGFNNTKLLLKKNYTLNCEKGIIKTTTDEGIKYSAILKSLEGVSVSSVLIYPEGLLVNYFLNVKSDDKFYSLIPLYVETFGEENIIHHFEITKPDYIIINDLDTFTYGYSKFGVDYANNIKSFIEENYQTVTNNKLPEDMLIYEKIK
ncbi:MAG: hypothetical protein MJ230_03890 [bacterium]|nr:hypothetical protein [bacterium]